MSSHLEKRARMEGASADGVQRKSTSPKKICNLSTQSFSEIVNYPTFVDKTLFIKAFLEADYGVIVALAPRRFGKSTNMDMVKEFLTGNKKLFQDNNLKIYKEERVFFDYYCQENPVIYLDFKNITGSTTDELLHSLKNLICDAFNEHRYLINEIDGKYSWSDTKLNEVLGSVAKFEKYWKKNPENLKQHDVTVGLQRLSQILHVYHNKRVYVLIDDFDSPIMNIIMDKTTSKNELQRATIDVIDYMMCNTFKGNEHLQRGLINACVRMADVLASEANNILYYRCLRSPIFSPYFGFTEAEVNSLLEKEEFARFKDDRVKEWYNGYTGLTASGDSAIYSCYSVLSYLSKSTSENKPCFDNYWVDSDCMTYLKRLFGLSEIRTSIGELMDGEKDAIKDIAAFDNIIDLRNLVHQEPNDYRAKEIFFQFLTENGYLNVVREICYNRSLIRIPNQEIRTLFKQKCYDVELYIKKHRLSLKNIEDYQAALKSVLTTEDKNAFIEYAKAVSKLFDGAIMPQDDNEFQCVIFVLAYNIKDYIVHSELSISQRKPTGRPRHHDLLVILNEAGLIVELKFDRQSSGDPRSQITTRQYYAALDDYKNLKKKILMGLHMTKEGQVSVTYAINGSLAETVTSHE